MARCEFCDDFVLYGADRRFAVINVAEFISAFCIDILGVRLVKDLGRYCYVLTVGRHMQRKELK